MSGNLGGGADRVLTFGLDCFFFDPGFDLAALLKQLAGRFALRWMSDDDGPSAHWRRVR